jgi:hypothetical protein
MNLMTLSRLCPLAAMKTLRACTDVGRGSLDSLIKTTIRKADWCEAPVLPTLNKLDRITPDSWFDIAGTCRERDLLS